MAVLTVQNIVETGLAVSTTAAAVGGDKFDNPTDERTYLQVTNGGGGSINVTITKQQSTLNAPGYGALALADRVVAVGAGATRLIGPFPAALYNDTNGQVNVAYSGVTSVTVAAIRMARAAG